MAHFVSSIAGSKMVDLVNNYDWANNALGPVESWSESLLTIVRLILNNVQPMWIAYGPENIMVYNDAYANILSPAKHPAALGAKFHDVWRETWEGVLSVLFADTLAYNTRSSDSIELKVQRSMHVEESHFSFCYAPLLSPDGKKAAGLYCTCYETTQTVVRERRLETLNLISSDLGFDTDTSKEQICRRTVEAMRANIRDIPFACVYLYDEESKNLRFCHHLNLDFKNNPNLIQYLPEVVSLQSTTSKFQVWKTQKLMLPDSGNLMLIDRIPTRLVSQLPLGVYDQRMTQAVVLRLGEPGTLAGFLILGCNPCLIIDEEYLSFYRIICKQVATNIQNIKILEQEKRQSEILRELDSSKTVFFSNISHEFRTPLSLILSPLDDMLVDSSTPLPAVQRERAELIQRSSQRLLKLVNALLDFSRIEAGRISATFQPTNIAQVTSDLCSCFQSTMAKAGIKYVVNTMEDQFLPDLDLSELNEQEREEALSEQVFIDREMWEKIVFNLLSNAYKFTLEGSITATLHRRTIDGNKFVMFSVKDTGSGIDKEDLPKLFNRFERITKGNRRSVEGSGIGLSFIKELVQLHGGTIYVESVFGEGSNFVVLIPLGYTHLQQSKVSFQCSSMSLESKNVLSSQYLSELEKWQPMDSPSSPLSSTDYTQSEQLEVSNSSYESDSGGASDIGSFSSTTTEVKHVIFVVDDNTDMRNYLTSLIAQNPYYIVHSYRSGMYAYNALLHRTPDLILSDVMMPDLDGFGLLNKIRQHPSSDISITPVILMSARAGEEAKNEGLKAGADDYLIKPFSAKEVTARVEGALRVSEIRKEAMRREKRLMRRVEGEKDKWIDVMKNLREGFFMLDRDWRYMFANDSNYNLVGKEKGISKSDIVGQLFFDVYPDLISSVLGKRMSEMMGSSKSGNADPITCEFYYEPHGKYYEHRIYSHPQGISVLTADISSRKRLEKEQMEKTNQKLKEVEDYRRKQSEFIDTLCHELRNPLNGIYCSSSLLLDEVRELEALFFKDKPQSKALESLSSVLKKMKEDVETIDQCAQQQKVIVDDVLDYSKLESNKVELNPEPFNLHSLINSILQMFNPQIKTKNLKFILTGDLQDNTKEIVLKADFHRLSQIIINLVSNAIKFTNQGSITIHANTNITTTAEATKHANLKTPSDPANAQIVTLTMSVQDTGIGMTAEESLKLFDRFVQASKTTTSKYGGSGLGLSICKLLTEIMGGDITVESIQNQGSTFTLNIQCLFLPEGLQSLEEQRRKAEGNGQGALDQGSEEKNKKIVVLIVEDNVINQKILRRFVMERGYVCLLARDGEEGVKKWMEGGVDVVLMDIEMPIKNGLEATREIRQGEAKRGMRGKRVGIVGLSGNASKEQIEMGMQVGMDDYLTKPYRKEDIYDRIDKFAHLA